MGIANHFYKGAQPAEAHAAPILASCTLNANARLSRRICAEVAGDFVLLSLDAAKLGAEVRFEAAAAVGDTPAVAPPDGSAPPVFPHLVRNARA
jgi:hypothetical protein